MKTFLPVAFCLLLLCASLTTSAQSVSWLLTNDGQSYNPQSVVQLPDESVVMIGSTTAASDSLLYYPTDFVVTRINKNGTVLWAKQANISADMYYSPTLFYANNALYIGFTSYDSISTSEGILKLDLNGNQLGCKMLPNAEYAYSTNRYAQLPNGNIVMMKSIMAEFQIICFDANLNVQWARRCNPDSNQTKNPGLGLNIGDDSTIIVSGKSDNRMVFTVMSPSGGFMYGFRFDNATKYLQARNVYKLSDGVVMQGLFMDYNSTSYASQSFVCKVDLNGNMAWFKTVSDALNSSYNFIISNGSITPEGHFMFSGQTTLGNFACGELDADGNVLWSKISSGSTNNSYYYYYGSSTGSGFAMNGNNAVIVHSETIYPYGAVGEITFTDHNTLQSHDVCGFQSSQVATTELGFDYVPYALPASSTSDLTVSYNTATILMNDVTQQFTASQLCETVVTNTEETFTQNTFVVIANPVQDVMTVSSNEGGLLRVYNTIGALVTEQAIHNGVSNINVRNLAAGIYVASFENNHHIVSQKVVVQK